MASTDPTMARIATLAAPFRPYVVEIVNHARRQGIPLIVGEGRRTLERQRAVVRAGRSQRMNSAHLEGYAVDFDVWQTAADRVAPWVWNTVGTYAERFGLVWGGRWATLRDYRHVEWP
jgi:peptidoglycan LD-endopeptidase CwlK